ncbi:flavodoxin family protein [Sphingobium fluviale]|uniref:Flavodoxin family protein n=1 Tax=Sphingobium fluviale TaxID=2506423 RepID=A0A4Q1KIB8_9SPHN|nr:flavodoxin family protein [Sphingobium fluviale]RXR29322.1 flavodoxin family protein [Sphingobium fluviale]
MTTETVAISVAIVYHSAYGHTQRVAEAIARGVGMTAGATPLLLTVEEVPSHWDDLEAADAIIFGGPTYVGSLSAATKAFMDASSPVVAVEKRWNGKIAGGFTNAGSRGGDKQNSLIQLMSFAAQHHMIWVGLGLGYGNNRHNTNDDILNRDTYSLGLATQSNIDQGEEAPPASDLRTAEFYGRRIADFAQIAVAGRRALGRPAFPDGPGGSEIHDPERRGILAPTT